MKQVAYRKIVAVKPIEHRSKKIGVNSERNGLSEIERLQVKELACRLKSKLLHGRTVIACAPTTCSQEMAHLFSCEFASGMPIICRSLNSRKPHNPEPSNLKALVRLVGNLVADYDNVVLLTHVGDDANYQVFSSWFLNSVLKIESDSTDLIQGGAVIVNCQV